MFRFLSFALLAYVFGFAAFMLALGRPAGMEKTDAIVVPTGGAGRIDRGLEVLKAGGARRMLVTGVDPDVRPIELALEYHVSPRLFACCIDLGQEAVDTRSNGRETAEWIERHGFRSVRLVTSDWHLPRARLELDNALNGEVRIVGDGVPTNARFGMLVSEYNKYLIRRAALLVGYSA